MLTLLFGWKLTGFHILLYKYVNWKSHVNVTILFVVDWLSHSIVEVT